MEKALMTINSKL